MPASCEVWQGPTATVAQLILLFATLASLAVKNVINNRNAGYHHGHLRNWRVWFFDVFKQLLGEGVGHCCGMLSTAAIHAAETDCPGELPASPCGWYIGIFLMDTIPGTAITIILHQRAVRMVRQWINNPTESYRGFFAPVGATGAYGDDAGVSLEEQACKWIPQAMEWMLSVFFSRLMLGVFLTWGVGNLQHMAQWVDHLFEGETLEVWMVMVLIPVPANIAQLWIQDMYLRFDYGHARVGDVALNLEEGGGVYGATQEDSTKARIRRLLHRYPDARPLLDGLDERLKAWRGDEVNLLNMYQQQFGRVPEEGLMQELRELQTVNKQWLWDLMDNLDHEIVEDQVARRKKVQERKQRKREQSKKLKEMRDSAAEQMPRSLSCEDRQSISAKIEEAQADVEGYLKQKQTNQLDLEVKGRQCRQMNMEIEDLKGSIRVFVRARPLSSGRPGSRQPSPRVTRDDDTIVGEGCVFFPDNDGDKRTVELFEPPTWRVHQTYLFDRAFSGTTTQEEVYMECRPLIERVLKESCTVCIFAYGQTGSGKTHTLTGRKRQVEQDMRGIARRMMDDVFDYKGQLGVRASMVQLYLNQFEDLLDRKKPLTLEQVRGDSVSYALHPAEKAAASARELEDIFSGGEKIRETRTTQYNPVSSRSHMIFTVSVDNRASGKTGKIVIVDLAGSERLSTVAAKQRQWYEQVKENPQAQQKEAIAINTSLLALGNVLADLNQHEMGKIQLPIRYNEHSLTKMMKQFFDRKDTKTLMFINVNPEMENVAASQSKQSIAYGRKAKGVTDQKLTQGDPRYVKMDKVRGQLQALEHVMGKIVDENDDLEFRRQQKMVDIDAMEKQLELLRTQSVQGLQDD